MNKYYVISCQVLWRELCYFASQSNNIFNFHFLQQGLHNTPELLKKELQKAIDSVPEEYSAILLGYGLCSIGLVGITARKTKLVVMRGHDCITFLLGSKEKYNQYFTKNPGTYWYSPGWIELGFVPGKEGFEKKKQDYIEKYGPENADYLMSLEDTWCKRYSSCTYVDLGIQESDKYKTYTQDCAQWLGWDFHSIQGNPKLIIDFLEGNWNSEDYLIVNPGQTIIATQDERIIDSVTPSENP